MKSNNLPAIIGIFVVIIIAILGWQLYNNSKTVMSGPVSQVATEKGYDSESKIDRTTPENTIASFMKNFIASAPPVVDENSLRSALALLSEGAKAEVSEVPISGDLARIIGVQDIPDGYTVGEIVYKDNLATGVENALAEAQVVLEYSGGDSPRLFLLSKVDNYWQIDGVMPILDQSAVN
jgi:hypothetical protein